MKPTEFKEQNCTYAKDQKEYSPLPSFRTPDGEVTSCWKLTNEELQEIIKTGTIWVSVLTFNHPLQPMSISGFKPDFENHE